ncbi:MAG: helix-turn-helix transcriptional regulator [Clostridiales bacterium]|nr:helix-turn-helix transcriptional regulator [Clostridiales bacterium]
MKDNFSFDLGNRLRKFRQSRGMSQEQTAHIADITPAYLGQVERGTKNITVYTLAKVCDALDISLSEFFGDGDVCGGHNKGIDAISNRILLRLRNRTEAEKQAILKMIEIVLGILK